MVEKLEALNLGDDGRVLIDLLNSTRAESVSGYQMCRSMLLQASIISGEYTAEAKHVELTVILNELGLLNHPRATVNMEPPEGLRVLTDPALLTNILFNASHNAMMHGATGGSIVIEAEVLLGMLVVTVANSPGDNHATLLAQGCADLLAESHFNGADAETSSFFRRIHAGHETVSAQQHCGSNNLGAHLPLP